MAEARGLERQASEFKPPAFANTAWAFATVNQARSGKGRASEFKLARVGVCNGEEFATLDRAAEWRVSEFKVQGFARASPTRRGRLQWRTSQKEELLAAWAKGAEVGRKTASQRSRPTLHGRLQGQAKEQRSLRRRSGLRYWRREVHSGRRPSSSQRSFPTRHGRLWAGVDGVKEAVTFVPVAFGGGCRRHRGCSKPLLGVQSLLTQAVGQQ